MNQFKIVARVLKIQKILVYYHLDDLIEDIPILKPLQWFFYLSPKRWLRNVTHKSKALASILKSIKPGGRLLVLEFSKPNALISPLYDFYSFNVLPKLGEWVVNDSGSYQYLAGSIRMHPDQESLKDMMETAGYLNCEYFNLSGGIVALHIGHKI